MVLVEDVTMAKSQKSLRVKLSGSWYGAYLDSGLNSPTIKGSHIEAEIVTLEKGGPWIKSWKQGIAAPQVQTPPAGGIPPSQSPAAAATPYKYAEPNLNVAPWWMPFVSNSVAHAIKAGIITAPNQIQPWAMAAKEAARGLVTKTPATQDSDIPF